MVQGGHATSPSPRRDLRVHLPPRLLRSRVTVRVRDVRPRARLVDDGIVPRSPCSRRTSPGQGAQRAYVATTEQVWALCDAMPHRLAAAIVLGAFAGLRAAEACGLRVADVDFMRGIIRPAVQDPAEPLKTEISRTPVPVPQSMARELARIWSGGRARRC